MPATKIKKQKQPAKLNGVRAEEAEAERQFKGDHHKKMMTIEMWA